MSGWHINVSYVRVTQAYRKFRFKQVSFWSGVVSIKCRSINFRDHKWKMEYCENASRLRAFVPGTGARPVGMGLPRAVWVKLYRLRTGVGRFHSSMHKWGLAPSPNCECGVFEQTADHVLTACPIHRAPHGARGLRVLDDETRCWLNNTTVSI